MCLIPFSYFSQVFTQPSLKSFERSAAPLPSTDIFFNGLSKFKSLQGCVLCDCSAPPIITFSEVGSIVKNLFDLKVLARIYLHSRLENEVVKERDIEEVVVFM